MSPPYLKVLFEYGKLVKHNFTEIYEKSVTIICNPNCPLHRNTPSKKDIYKKKYFEHTVMNNNTSFCMLAYDIRSICPWCCSSQRK